MTGFGFFVRLNDLFIDGLVHISGLANDYYLFDMPKQRLIGENSGMIFRLGDAVKVRIEAVSLEQKQIDFSLISSERKPKRSGKTARTKAKKSEVKAPKKTTTNKKAKINKSAVKKSHVSKMKSNAASKTKKVKKKHE